MARSYIYWASFLGIPVVAVFGRREKWREEMLALGATHYIVAGERDPLAAARGQGIGPFARAIEAVGSLAALETALSVIGREGVVAPYGILPPVAQWPEPLRQARESGRIRSYPVDE